MARRAQMTSLMARYNVTTQQALLRAIRDELIEETWDGPDDGPKPTLRDAEFVATVWTDYTLLAQALERGDSLTDAATIEAALLPDLGLQVLRAWLDTLVARRPRVPADRIDSIYAHDTVRVFQHVLFRVRDPQDVRLVGAARAVADSIFALARDTTVDFAALARARSEDSTTAASGGWLPAGPRGTMPPEFERGAWGLPPGAVAGLASRAGFHIVRARQGQAQITLQK